MKKAMISQPMFGKTDEEIKEARDKAVDKLTRKNYTVVNTFFEDDPDDGDVVQIPLYFLAKSLEKMSLCHAVYFCKGWEYARGCKIEHDAAVSYGLKIIYED